MYEAYLRAFPDIHRYLQKVKQEAKRLGYILISPFTGRKYWCKDFDVIKQDRQLLNKFAKLACNYPKMCGASLCEERMKTM